MWVHVRVSICPVLGACDTPCVLLCVCVGGRAEGTARAHDRQCVARAGVHRGAAGVATVMPAAGTGSHARDVVAVLVRPSHGHTLVATPHTASPSRVTVVLHRDCD